MSRVRNGERPTDAFSSRYEGRTELVNLRSKPGYQVPEGDELLPGERDDGTTVDDELVTNLQRTVSQTIRSAQEVANALIARARKREALIRAKTEDRCSRMVAHAEHEATAILQRAAAEAVGKVRDAESDIAAMLAAADRRRDQVLAELERESKVLEDKIARLRHDHDRIAQALEVADTALREGRRALEDDVDWAARGRSSGRVAPSPRNGAGRSTVQAYAAGDAANRQPSR